MKPTKKEMTLLNDLKASEEMCVEKYSRYEKEAKDKALKSLFNAIGKDEKQHLDTINTLISGTLPDMSGTSPDNKNKKVPETVCYKSGNNTPSKEHDAFLCSDSLASEKHISSSYNTSVFEFTNTEVRDALNHIQKEEQEHGKQIYDYMSANSMYN